MPKRKRIEKTPESPEELIHILANNWGNAKGLDDGFGPCIMNFICDAREHFPEQIKDKIPEGLIISAAEKEFENVKWVKTYYDYLKRVLTFCWNLIKK